MSAGAFAWAWRQALAPSPRVILCVLAHQADAQGRCCQRVEEIAAACHLSDRATRNGLDLLEQRGFIRKDAKNGAKSAYLLIGHLATPRQNVPRSTPKNRRESPAHPAALLVQTPAQSAAAKCAALDSRAPADEVPLSPVQETAGTEGSRAKPERATRLPADWQPTPAEATYATERGLDLVDTVENFRGYYITKPGIAGRSLNWPESWRRWCRRQVKWDAERAARAQPARRPAHNGAVELLLQAQERAEAEGARVIDPWGSLPEWTGGH